MREEKARRPGQDVFSFSMSTPSHHASPPVAAAFLVFVEAINAKSLSAKVDCDA